MAINIDLTKTQQYLDWMKEKLYLNSKAETAKKRKVSRGQVYRCHLGIGVGSEESKERPCVILQYNAANSTSPNTIVAPITHTSSTLNTVIPIQDKKDNNGTIILDGNVLLGNVMCVSKARLGDYVADLSLEEMRVVDEALAASFDLLHYHKTLENKYNDKLIYIDKLNAIRRKLEDELKAKQLFEDRVNVILKNHKISSIDELDNIL
jgi:mRNA interferase MazF